MSIGVIERAEADKLYLVGSPEFQAVTGLTRVALNSRRHENRSYPKLVRVGGGRRLASWGGDVLEWLSQPADVDLSAECPTCGQSCRNPQGLKIHRGRANH